MLDPVWEWFRWLHDAHGINLTIFYDPVDRQKFLREAHRIAVEQRG